MNVTSYQARFFGNGAVQKNGQAGISNKKPGSLQPGFLPGRTLPRANTSRAYFWMRQSSILPPLARKACTHFGLAPPAQVSLALCGLR